MLRLRRRLVGDGENAGGREGRGVVEGRSYAVGARLVSGDEWAGRAVVMIVMGDDGDAVVGARAMLFAVGSRVGEVGARKWPERAA